MKNLCKECQEVLTGSLELSFHESIHTIFEKELNEQQMFYFYCESCHSVLRAYFTIFNPTQEKVEKVVDAEITNEVFDWIAYSLYANERRKWMEDRIDFLDRGTMPVYEPIDKEEYEAIKEAHFTNVHKLPSYYLMNEVDEEAEETYWYVYAEPSDFYIAQTTTKVPRFFRSFLIPASDSDVVSIGKCPEPRRMALWLHDVAMLKKIMVYDALAGKHIPIKEFAEMIQHEDELFMELPIEQKETILAPFKEQVREIYQMVVVNN